MEAPTCQLALNARSLPECPRTSVGWKRTNNYCSECDNHGKSTTHPTAYLETNVQMESQFGQAFSAQRNLTNHYSTGCETQLVQELSADEEDLRQIQAKINMKRAALATGTREPSISTQNPNLSAQNQANLNPYTQHFETTSVPSVALPWLMPGYVAPHSAPLY